VPSVKDIREIEDNLRDAGAVEGVMKGWGGAENGEMVPALLSKD
jgi:hypothetical protein